MGTRDYLFRQTGGVWLMIQSNVASGRPFSPLRVLQSPPRRSLRRGSHGFTFYYCVLFVYNKSEHATAAAGLRRQLVVCSQHKVCSEYDRVQYSAIIITYTSPYTSGVIIFTTLSNIICIVKNVKMHCHCQTCVFIVLPCTMFRGQENSRMHYSNCVHSPSLLPAGHHPIHCRAWGGGRKDNNKINWIFLTCSRFCQ